MNSWKETGKKKPENDKKGDRRNAGEGIPENAASGITAAGLSGAAFETVSRYGSAQKEHIFAYTGTDYENNVTLKRGGLRHISESKVHPDYENSNLRSQAGYAAENKYAARENASHIIRGDRVRIRHTDTGDSGRYDELRDHLVTRDGRIIGGEQMKFVGDDARQCLNAKLLSKDYEKYLDNDIDITLPSDYFKPDASGKPEIIGEIDSKIASLKKQIDSGKLDRETLAGKERQLRKCQKLKRLVKNSNISKAEALEARNHPEWSTIKDMTKVAHEAGWEQAKTGAVIGAAISSAMNALAVIRGDKNAGEATRDIATATAAAAATGYITAAAGSLIKGSMQNSASSVLRAASKSNLPAAMVTAGIEASKIIKKCLAGELSAGECSAELGEAGANMIGSSLFAVAGQILIPIPVAGAMAGSMIGCAITSASLGVLKTALREENLERQRRIMIERECEDHIRRLREFEKELDRYFERYFEDMKDSLTGALSQMKTALNTADSGMFVRGCNSITEKLGGKVAFSNRSEFDSMMASDEVWEF